MTVQEFVDKYKSFNNKTLRNQFLQQTVVTEYVPYSQKIAICKRIADVTSHVDVNGKQMYKLDSNSRFMLYVLNLFEQYSSISINFEKGLEEFELLDALTYEYEEEGDTVVIGLIQAYIQLYLPAREVASFDHIMEVTLGDMIENENAIIPYIDTKIGAIGMVFESLIAEVWSTIKNEMSESDWDLLKGLLKDYKKA